MSRRGGVSTPTITSSVQTTLVLSDATMTEKQAKAIAARVTLGGSRVELSSG